MKLSPRRPGAPTAMTPDDLQRRRLLRGGAAVATLGLTAPASALLRESSIAKPPTSPLPAPSATMTSDLLNETPRLSAAALGRAFRDGRADPVAALEHYLSKASATSSVFIGLTPQRARAEAEASAERWRQGVPLGPLDGVPVAWKDLFDIQGTVTTAGAAVFAHHPPATADSPLVDAAARGGLVCLGKTNLVEFAFSGLGLNPHFGTPHNPFDTKVARVPGGSSSGSAVAVAAGAVPIAMGTDTAGSVRIPAAFNGLVGYKSSGARYPRNGVFPLSRTLDSLGPLAHTVEDCILIDGLFRGQPQPSLKPADLRGQTFVVDEALLQDPRVQDSVRANLDRAVDTLRDRGARIERKRVAALHEVADLIQSLGWLAAPEALAVHESLLASDDAARMDPRVRKRLEGAREFSGLNYVKLQWARERLIVQIREQLDGAVLVTPTVAHVAPELAPLEQDTDLFFKTNLATLRLTMLGSFLDMPGVALPMGTDASGLPTSLLLSLPSGDDDRLLPIALAAEQAGLSGHAA